MDLEARVISNTYHQKKTMKLFKYSKFKFGEQHVSQFILFEHKKLFSIIFFYFHKSNGNQDRFHTHAFNAYSFRIFGNYIEEKRIGIVNHNTNKLKYMIFKENRNESRLIYIPKNSWHRITKSNGCLTLLLSGPWGETWQEYFPKNQKTITYSHNRIIKESNQ